MPDTVLVSGATSQLGVFLLPRLRDAGFQVRALSRKAPARPFEPSASVRWLQTGKEMGPANYLVSCGPLSLAADLAVKCEGLSRLVAFSTTSVWTKADSADPGEKDLISGIQAQEQRLWDVCEQHGIALALLRPTLVYGCGLDRNISLLARFGRRFGFIPLASGARGLRQPVHADDLAALAVQCLANDAPIRLESAACGGSTLAYKKMVELTAAACGQHVRALAINARWFAALVRLAAIVPALRELNPEMITRQQMDMVFDDSPLRTALGYEPRAFQPVPEDFEIPQFARDLQLPG